jgi:hypothetical protein
MCDIVEDPELRSGAPPRPEGLQPRKNQKSYAQLSLHSWSG